MDLVSKELYKNVDADTEPLSDAKTVLSNKIKKLDAMITSLQVHAGEDPDTQMLVDVTSKQREILSKELQAAKPLRAQIRTAENAVSKASRE